MQHVSHILIYRCYQNININWWLSVFGLALREAETSILRIWKIFHLRLDSFCFLQFGLSGVSGLHFSAFIYTRERRELLILFSLNWHTTNVIRIDMMFTRCFVTFCTYHDPKCNLEHNKTSQRDHSDQWDITPTPPTQTTKEHCQTFMNNTQRLCHRLQCAHWGWNSWCFFLFQEKKVK